MTYKSIEQTQSKPRLVRKSLAYEDVVKSADPFFNHKAAKEAYDLVMKMDRDEAEVFTSFVVRDVLEDTIEANQRTLQGHLNEVVAKRLDEVKKATIRTVSKRSGGEEDIGFAQALALVEEVIKAKTPQDYGYVWDEKDFRRDPATGRFRTKIKHPTKKPLNDRRAAEIGINPKNKTYSKLPSSSKAQYQDEYRQLAQFLTTVGQSGDGDAKVMLHYKDKAGNTFSSTQNGTSVPTSDLMENASNGVRLVGAEAKPSGLNVGGAAFGLSGALGRPINARTVDQINAADKGFTGFSDNWLNAGEGDNRNSNARLYGRVEAGSKFLGQVAPAGSKVEIAAKFGEFVGSHGPEAEKVFGPATRKNAYRYRGTEKTPDSKIANAYGRAIQGAKMSTASAGQNRSMSQMAQDRVAAQRRAPNSDEVLAGRKILLDYLSTPGNREVASVPGMKGGAPKKGLYNLQLASGNTPPSEGFIINSDGQIAAQAVGYGDDHYLPFNLKNLKALKGGEYVRNRSVGGLTSEDVYVGLMSGAKRVTVVSRSGTFTMEFEKDFRGARRHNDKAKRMTRRYEQILDAVQSRQVDRMDISPELRQAITAEVRDENEGLGLNRAEMRDAVQDRIEDFKSSPELNEEDEKYAERMVSALTNNGTTQDAAKIRGQVYNDIAAMKEYKFRLNGMGYAAGLDALAEQFPYYITVSSAPTKDPERVEPEIDRGYVEPGRNRPTSAKAGLYGTKANESGKFSAAEADYQGARGRAANRSVGNAHEESKENKGSSTSSQTRQEKMDEVSEKIEETKNEREYAEAAREVQRFVVKTYGPETARENAEVLAYDANDLKDPKKREKFHDFFETVAEAAGASMGAVGVNYRRSERLLDREPYDESRAGTWDRKPYKFKGSPKKPERKNKRLVEITRANGNGLIYEKGFPAMTDDELQAEHAATVVVRDAVAASLAKGEPLNLDDVKDAGITNVNELRRLRKDPDPLKGLDRRIRDIHETRALLSGMSVADRKAASARANQVTAHPRPTVTPSDNEREQEHMREIALAREAEKEMETNASAYTDDERVRMTDYRIGLESLQGRAGSKEFQAMTEEVLRENKDAVSQARELAAKGKIKVKTPTMPEQKKTRGGGSILSS